MLPFEQLEQLQSWLEHRLGNFLLIHERLCSNGEHFDRHFTSHTTMQLQLEQISVRISGARVMLLGANGTQYELAADNFYQIQLQENRCMIYERLGSWVRCTEIQRIYR